MNLLGQEGEHGGIERLGWRTRWVRRVRVMN